MPSSELEEGIRWGLVGPSSGKGADEAGVGVVEEDAELGPGEAPGQKHEMLAEQRVKRVGYGEDN